MLPRGYSLQFSSSHTRRVQMNPNATKLNQYEQTLIQERLKQTRSKMNQAANAQNAASLAAQQNKNDKDKKLQSKKENIPEKEQIADSPESGNTKKRKQQEKILEKQAAKSLKQQNQVLQQVISVDTQQKGTIPVSEDIRVCFSILQQLKKSENAGPFLQKVDALAQQCPDYYKIIRDPMDLSKVESNLKQGYYQTTLQFADDVRKIWNNSFTYNQKGSQIYKMTEEMSRLFEKIFTQVKSQSLPNPMEYHEQQDNKKKKKIGKLEKKDIPLTISEKKQLGINIRRLPPEDLNGIWSIVQDSQQNSEVIEFDIDTLPVRKARELEAYVKQRAAFQQKKQRVQKNQPNNLLSDSQQQAKAQLPYSTPTTTTTASTTVNTNQTPIDAAVNNFPQQTSFTAAQQYPATAYASNPGYTQANQLIQNNGSAQNAASAKVNNSQMIQQGQYVQANPVAQQQLPIAQATTQQNMASIQGYNHLNQQQYAQQSTYQNQMMMNQYPSAFPIQQPMQSAVIGGYQNRPSQQYDAGQQGMAIPSMINQTQQPYSGQQYNQQGQAQYQGYGNNMQNMYMNQPLSANSNGNHNRNIVPNQQIQYGANTQVQNGISQYPQSQNYYNAQYQSNPSQYQQHLQQMNVNPQYSSNSNQAQQYNGHIQNQNNSEQSSEAMLSESEEE